jgi:hypothetical protein
MGRIAGALADRSAPTKTGKSHRWTHQAAARILKRERRVPTDLSDALA